MRLPPAFASLTPVKHGAFAPRRQPKNVMRSRRLPVSTTAAGEMKVAPRHPPSTALYGPPLWGGARLAPWSRSVPGVGLSHNNQVSGSGR